MSLLGLSVVCAAFASGCGSSKCDPTAFPDNCPSGERCSSATLQCVTPPPCTQDSDCANGLACGASTPKVCFVNCYALGSPTSIFCAGNFTCNAAAKCQ